LTFDSLSCIFRTVVLKEEQMTEINRYALALEAYTELKPEIELAQQTQPVPALPSLSEVLAEFGTMPNEALFLGVATDGLPVLRLRPAQQMSTRRG
jgi:hypothetical protein